MYSYLALICMLCCEVVITVNFLSNLQIPRWLGFARSLANQDPIDPLFDQIEGTSNYQLKLRRVKKNSMSRSNLTRSLKKQCTPGSMYIIKCRYCMCPYSGNIEYFCRPMPEDQYCEQPFPNYNYIPMARRIPEPNSTHLNTSMNVDYLQGLTKRQCPRTGKIMDHCFVCECEENVVIEELCFKSEADECADAKPTLLTEYAVILEV